MKIYEYAAKKIFNEEDIPIPRSKVVESPQEAQKATEEIGVPVAIKSQVLVGGRGKAGGIKFADNPQEACQVSQKLFGMEIKGEKVEKLLIEEKLDIKSEYYLSVALDRSARQALIMASTEGGVNIEEVARKNPQKILKHHIDPLEEFLPYMARDIARKMGVTGALIPGVGTFIFKLYNVFQKYDANLAEINPLVVTSTGIIAADAKLDIDDDALYRQKKLAHLQQEYRDEFAYVKLDGDIAVIGNGAGLTLTGMDMINLYGGKPATFLDIGGGASQENIARALNLVISNPNVKVVFLNVLGGITRADDVARGVVDVLDKSNRSVPIVIRLTGTNEEEGQRILKEAGVSFETSMEAAAKKAVEILEGL
ncbi:MAG TPA: ADP-forming succinate--CoA ligase subunit beta [Methanobacteriaceae archaeon]|nr:ADP-forming succinate--CoA ligase subunit beta [Methanobacteriaceae archaeon]